ncbi:hypothetical protein PF011_g27105 [Phytophthora fragariae]|uniref:CCHC-type domain-containing protein n=1 Tax=Phytophthora fragariae TaxID=53985 RepID=A0A6A3HGQ2_9STRA|nr:hypothetical protein PF011_g27105 [Phytophthora fragariae]
MAYLHAELNNFLREDPVMRTMHLKLLGSLTGPVQAPLSTKNKLVAAVDLLRLLKEAGLTAGAFDADDLFHLEVDEIRVATAALFNLLKPMVGERPAARRPKPFSLLKPLDDDQPAVKPAEPKSAQAQSPEYHTGSSQYASATSEAGSDSSSGSRRMSLGPSGAAMLQARAAGDLSVKAPTPRPTEVTSSRASPRTPPQDPANSLESYFQAAMSRFLSERPEMRTPRQRAIHSKIGERDVDMESVVSQDHPELWEYDPDDLDIGATRRTAATAAVVAPTGSPAVQRVEISAISDLKEFTGKDRDEERARGWIGKVKQLRRSTRTKWSDLLQSFQTQYCGLGVSVAWQYYHARKRSEETPLEYLHRLNVAGMRARLKIKDGDSKGRLEHVEHFIETLGDPDLADQLTLLRLADADQLEDVLRARERAKSRQKKSTVPSKHRPKPAAPTPPAGHPTAVRAIQVAETRSEYGSDPEDSGSDGELVRAYAAAASDQPQTPAAGEPPKALDPGRPSDIPGDSQPQEHRPRFNRDGQQRYSHCGSHRHSDLGCWKRLTCQKCGKRGHPSDRCFFVCRGCGQLHDHGKCQMEEFYNLIRQWFDPS